MINHFSPNFKIILFIYLLLTGIESNAQISVGTSSQINFGWAGITNTTTRHTRVTQQGTSGENIAPTDGSGNFGLYGTSFTITDKQNSFDYASTLKSDNIVSDLQENTFSVYGSYSGTSTRSTSPSLGWYESGNVTFQN